MQLTVQDYYKWTNLLDDLPARLRELVALLADLRQLRLQGGELADRLPLERGQPLMRLHNNVT